MAENKQIPVKDLQLDLQNFRTVPQKTESDALDALIAIKPDKFWALLESLLDDGYINTENILVLKDKRKHIVKEGNRRVAALKLIHGSLKPKNQDIPRHIIERISSVKSTSWISENRTVPCIVYSSQDKEKVEKLVARTHAKGATAGRDPWPAIATARYNRDQLHIPEYGLDILEKFLAQPGDQITETTREVWSGDYQITVLNEALQKVIKRIGFSSLKELAEKYPAVRQLTAINRIIRDIGLKTLTFPVIRSPDDFLSDRYGLHNPIEPSKKTEKNSREIAKAKKTTTPKEPQSLVQPTTTDGIKKSTKQALPIEDPQSFTIKLKAMKIEGAEREKVASLREEFIKLKIGSHPLAASFLMRSMFEISAKAYCNDNVKSGGPQFKEKDGKDKPLVKILKEVHQHIKNVHPEKERDLHGALTVFTQHESILSVHSMNQLVHNPNYSVKPSDLSILFHNIFPLLREMNAQKG